MSKSESISKLSEIKAEVKLVKMDIKAGIEMRGKVEIKVKVNAGVRVDVKLYI